MAEKNYKCDARLVKELLEKHGYKVEYASDGLAATKGGQAISCALAPDPDEDGMTDCLFTSSMINSDGFLAIFPEGCPEDEEYEIIKAARDAVREEEKRKRENPNITRDFENRNWMPPLDYDEVILRKNCDEFLSDYKEKGGHIVDSYNYPFMRFLARHYVENGEMPDPEREICTCEFCNVTGFWDEGDRVKGNFFECESCGKIFCESCFEERRGGEALEALLNGSIPVVCPDCYEKEN